MDFYLAPLEGITTHIFRNAVHHWFGDGISKYFTPFIEPHIHKKNLKHRELADILPENNAGITLVPQVLTNSAEAWLFLEEELTPYGYRELNLNLGCPSPTVVTKGRGAAMLQRPEELRRMLDGIFEKTNCEISVKTRIGYADPAEWPALLDVFSAFPLKELIVHARVREELYGYEPHYDAFCEALLRCPHRLCYNGDITDAAGYARAMTFFSDNAAGRLPDAVMAGRGMLADPSLLCRLAKQAAAAIITDGNDGDSSGLMQSSQDPLTKTVPKQEKACQPSLKEGSVREPVDLLNADTAAVEDPAALPDADTAAVDDPAALPDADMLRAFTDEIFAGYCAEFSGEVPVLHKMKEIWTWLITDFPDSRRLLKPILKSKNFREYRAAADAALRARA